MPANSKGSGVATAVSRVKPRLQRVRWLLIGVFILSNVLNFLDRQVLAALAPTLRGVFHISSAQYGAAVSVFSLAYAAATPFAGLFIDRVGLDFGVVAAVGLWSFAGFASATVGSFRGLLICRSLLGLGEAAGLPFLSKANATYLPPAEWGLASAVGAVAVTGGNVLAPLLVAVVVPHYGWRSVFFISGALGIVWIVIWYATTRLVTLGASMAPTLTQASAFAIDADQGSMRISSMLRDQRLWRVASAYALVMIVFMLWLNWTTLFLVQHYHLAEADANRHFAWVPPIFGAAGGLCAGAFAFRWIRRGAPALGARKRICTWCLPLFPLTAAIPFFPSPALAMGGACIALFACQSVAGSLNVMPIDLFGAGRAAFGISLLACCFSLIQTFMSPIIGWTIDRFGFSAVCVVASLLPVFGVLVLKKMPIPKST